MQASLEVEQSDWTEDCDGFRDGVNYDYERNHEQKGFKDPQREVEPRRAKSPPIIWFFWRHVLSTASVFSST